MILERWGGKIWIRWETGPRYVLSKVIQLPSLLTTWDIYLPRYVYKERTEDGESRLEKLYESGYIDLMM